MQQNLTHCYTDQTGDFQPGSPEQPRKQGVSLKFKQFIAYGKAIINFYKSGIKNVWQNQSILKS